MGKYRAADVAACIVKAAIDRHRPISNLQLQKILFFTQCDYMREHEGATLFDDEFEAWQFGPVVPSVYFAYSIYGGSAITKPAQYASVSFFGENNDKVRQLEGDALTSVRKSTERWGDLPAWCLVNKSHDAKGAWYRVFNANGRPGSGYRDTIPLPLIRETLDVYK